ncbi:MAG: YebG family protein [Desulfatitalea sp.]
MSVITKFIVVRNGVELEQTFTDKKEAEAYDLLLDASEELAELIKQGDLQINVDPKTIDAVAIFLAKNAPAVTKILKAVRPIKSGSDGINKSKMKTVPEENKDRAPELRAKSKSKAA